MSGSRLALCPPPGFQTPVVAVTRKLAFAEQLLREQGIDPVNFGGGKPNPRAIDVDRYDVAANRHIERLAASGALAGLRDAEGVKNFLANYAASQSHQALREIFANGHGRDTNITLNPGRLLPTIGNTQAIALMLAYYASLERPVAVFCEEFAYTGLLSVATRYPNVKLFPVTMDRDGMMADHLEAQMKQASAQGFTMGFTYLVPDGGNPSGITIPHQRRREIYDATVSFMRSQTSPHGPIIFEDNPYHFIQLDKDKAVMALAADDPHGIVHYAFSASKIGFPDKRVAWSHLPLSWLEGNGEEMKASLYAAILAQFAGDALIHSSFNLAAFNGQMFGENGSFVGLWPRAAELRDIYAPNGHTLWHGLNAALGEQYGDLFSLSPMPRHGFVITLRLNDLAQRGAHLGVTNSGEFANWLLTRKGKEVIVTPMTGFLTPGSGPAAELAANESVRLAFSAPTFEETQQGVELLIAAIKELYQL